MPLKRARKSKNTTPSVPRVSRGRRFCAFCESKTIPSYTDSAALRRFMSDRSKIVARSRTNLCAKHQRALTREIKHARHLALLPFVTRV